MVYDCIDNIQALIYPPSCLLCGAPGHRGIDLCKGCHRDLPFNHHCCPRCALPLPPGSADNQLCGGCGEHSPAFDRCITPLLYRSPVDFLVSGLKFRQQLSSGRLLSQLLLDELVRIPRELPELLIPVPLHGSRLAERGYNQALELARPISRLTGIALDYRCCVRRHPTLPQVGLERNRRRENMRGAFLIRRTVAARHLALIDDVVTTGATVSELARLLKQGGVERVDVWAAARTP